MQRLLHFALDSDTSGYFPQLARWHDREQYQMYFATLGPMAPWLEEYMHSQGVSTFSCHCRSRKSYPQGLWRFVQILRKVRIDILHAHLFDPSVVGLTAGILAGIKLRVMTRHYSDYHTRIQKHWHVKLDQWCNWAAHSIIAVSEHTKKHLVEVEHTRPKKITTVLNGIDFDRVQLSSSDAPKRLREEYLQGESGFLLLVVGRLHSDKGYEFLFPALPKLRQLVTQPVTLLIAGSGTYLDRYQEMVRSLGWSDRVHFLGYRKDVCDLMAAADLIVLPSVAEAFGLVLAEALYLGTPVLATRTGGIPEVIDDGVDGVLVPPADSQALAEGIARMLNDSDLRQRLAGAGRDKVREKFGFETMVREYEKVYSRSLSDSE